MLADATGILAWRDELVALEARLGQLFVRPEPRRQAGLYLEGLLSAVERKNGWQLAEQIGDARPWRTQRVLSHVLWDQDAARDLCRDYVLEHIAADDGVLIVARQDFSRRASTRPAWRGNTVVRQAGSRMRRSGSFWSMPAARATR